MRGRAPALGLLAGGLAWAGGDLGWWWLTFVVGVGLGAALAGWRARSTLLAGVIAAIAGWGLPLAWTALFAPVGATATAVSGIMGMGGGPGLPAYAFTLVTGLLLALAGAWTGRAAVTGYRSLRATGP